MRRRYDYRQAKRAIYGKYRARCSHCEARRTLTKLPGFYTRPPRCPNCKKADWRIDWYRTTKRESKATTCNCGAFPGRTGTMPHRRGSTRILGDTLLVCYRRTKPLSEELSKRFADQLGELENVA